MTSGGNNNTPLFLMSLQVSETHPCPYLPGREAIDCFGLGAGLDGAAYERLMDMGFRRSGHIIYRPMCNGCNECRPLRVHVCSFAPSRSQRRVLRRNQDVSVSLDDPVATDEKWQIYASYLRFQHDGTMSDSREDFERFLYQSPVPTMEMTYRLDGRIVGVGIVDIGANCLSSVYFYFSPDEARRSLGVFSSLTEISTCERLEKDYWYAGFYVRECRRMNYKASFRPHELLDEEGRWSVVETSKETP